MNIRLLFLLPFVLNAYTVIAQVEGDQPDTSGMKEMLDLPYVTPEKYPEYPGGRTELNKFLAANLHLPASAKKTRVYGKVYVSFIVEADGSVIHAMIAKGIGHDCDQEALRVVKLMPTWKPALLKGSPIAMKQTIPLLFNAQTQDE